MSSSVWMLIETDLAAQAALNWAWRSGWTLTHAERGLGICGGGTRDRAGGLFIIHPATKGPAQEPGRSPLRRGGASAAQAPAAHPGAGPLQDEGAGRHRHSR